jgi:hypothetical protein
MTMPNPVAEVVERLRWYARHYFSHVPRYETLTLDRCMSINEMLATAADEIERLSREKEAGEFWSGVFSEITDKTEREKIAAELTDFHFMMDQVPQVYMHITGGRMSKTNYYAADVIAEADDYAQECFRKDTDAEIEPLKAEIERLSRERDTADEHFVVINGPDGACVEVVSGRDRLVETCRNILWSGEGDVPEDVLAILDTVGNPDADEWTEHGAPARLRFDFEDGALEILRVNFMPRAVSRERDTGVPEGFWLAPIKPTDKIMTAAAEAHFGKRRTAQNGGIDGIGMTVDGRDLSFRDAFKSFWKGARSAAPQPPTVSTPEGGQS